MIDDDILEAIDYLFNMCCGEDFCRGIRATKEMLMDYDGMAWPDMTDEEKEEFVNQYR